jgi:hypothetical protein
MPDPAYEMTSAFARIRFWNFSAADCSCSAPFFSSSSAFSFFSLGM